MLSVTMGTMAAFSVISCQKVSEKAEVTAHPWFKLAPPEDNKAFESILEKRENKDFEGAVAIALNGVDGKPPDDFLLETIADTYFEGVQEEPDKREQWVKLAVQYSERASKTKPDDVVNVFNLGESYFLAGMNLSTPISCSYYKKALEEFQQLKADPILKNESGVIEGELVAMQPYRQKLDEEINQVRLLESGCPSIQEKQ